MLLLSLTESVVEEEFVGWPTLAQLRLGRTALDERSGGIGGSDANILLSGNGERIRQLWLEKRGEPERRPAPCPDCQVCHVN